MMMAAATAFAFTVGTTPGQAATTTSMGVDNLLVGSTLYDVEFKQGTCVGLFGGCDEEADFAIGPESVSEERLINAFGCAEMVA